jgi:hypothetical protein
MADMIDPIHFQDLEKLNPQEVCRRAICNYSPEDKSYTLTAWGENYRLSPQTGIIERLGPQPTRDHG